MRLLFVMTCSLAGLAILGCPTKAPAAAMVHSEEPAVTAPVRLYAIIYNAGPKWKKGRPLAEQGLRAHGLYMRAGVEKGDILAAGPLPSIEGGLVLIRAESLAAARSVMMSDPAVQEGIFVGTASEWVPALDPQRRFATSAPAP